MCTQWKLQVVLKFSVYRRFCEKNADFVFFMNAQVTRKMINLLNLFFMNYVGASARNSLQYLICLKSVSTDIFTNEKGKVVLFVFVALRPMSTAMVIVGRSVHLTALFPGQA